MYRLIMILLLTACAAEPGDTGPADTADTSDTADTGTQADPAVDLTGRWTVPDGTALPSQADTLWCTDAQVGDYNDEMWFDLDQPVTCFENTPGGCRNDLEFDADGKALRHVRYGADGPCPFDGVSNSVVAWEPWGAWSLTSTDGETDVYQVDGREWTVYALGDFIVVNSPGVREFTLSPGIGREFIK